MKTNIEYGVFYVNETTKEKVAFHHAIPVRFNKEQANSFIKDMNYDKWVGGGTPLPNEWTMQSLPLDITH